MDEMSIERTLTIKRVPTVLSNYQENASSEDLESKGQGCGRNCLGKCCLPVSTLPIYAFKNVEHEMVENGIDLSCGRGPPMSFLNNLLLGQWEERMNRGLFRYDVTTCETKVIPGRYGFIAQLNEGRHLKKRATEFRIDQVLQPFDDNKFNFTKVGQEEVLFRFEPSNDNEMHYFPSSTVDGASGSPNVVAINVSPIEYGHVLLIPRVLDCFPQRIDNESFLLALHLARETADPAFRVGYNSLGAFATINHLHFQAYYLSLPLPIEKAPTCILMTSKGPTDTGVIVSKLLDYPVSSLVFEGECTLHDLSDAVANSCVFLQNNNIPFNVLIADCGRRIFLLPQSMFDPMAEKKIEMRVEAMEKKLKELKIELQYLPGLEKAVEHLTRSMAKMTQSLEAIQKDVASLINSKAALVLSKAVMNRVIEGDTSGSDLEVQPPPNILKCYAEKQALGEVGLELLDTQVNPAVWEISGHIVLKRRKYYDEASEQYAWRLLSEVSLSEKRFQEVMHFIAEAAGFLQVEDDITANHESGVPRTTSHLHKDCLVQH